MVALRDVRVLAVVLVMQLCMAALAASDQKETGPEGPGAGPPPATPAAAGPEDQEGGPATPAAAAGAGPEAGEEKAGPAIPAAAAAGAAPKAHEDDFEVGELAPGGECADALNMDPSAEYKFGLSGHKGDKPNGGYKDMKHLWKGILGCAKNLVGLGKELQKRSKVATHKNAQYARDFSRVEYTLDYLSGTDVLNAFAKAHRLQKLSYLRTLSENVAWMKHLAPYTSFYLQQAVNEYKPPPSETEAYNMMEEKPLKEVRGHVIRPQQYDRFYNVPERITGREARHRLEAKGGTDDLAKNEDNEDHYGSHYATKDVDNWQKLDQDDERKSVKDFFQAVHDSVHGAGIIEEGAERERLKGETKHEKEQGEQKKDQDAQADRETTESETPNENESEHNGEQAAASASNKQEEERDNEEEVAEHRETNGVTGDDKAAIATE